jgi:hypothetical protein
MADRPILFSGPMVRALLDGRKTQTRRVIPQPEMTAFGWNVPWQVGGGCILTDQSDEATIASELLNGIRIVVGDRLWVREAWKAHSTFEGTKPRDITPSKVFYLADRSYSPSGSRGRPGMFMPRWASRLTLPVTDVRVERLKDISEADAIAEGVVWSDQWQGFVVPGVEHPNKDFPVLSRPTAREMYAALWDVINGPGAWLGNPWVSATTFTVHRANIDAMPAREAA